MLAVEVDRKMELAQLFVRRGIDAELLDLEDLRRQATLSLARILTKQGCVSAKAGDHDLALVRFQKTRTAFCRSSGGARGWALVGPKQQWDRNLNGFLTLAFPN